MSKHADLEDLEAQFRVAREQQWEDTPEHIKQLGDVLRRSVDRDVDELASFLKEHEIEVEPEKLEEFRDTLIVQRVDLKDIEPEARERLRARFLAGDDPRMMTADYREAAASGELPRCRSCRWFVTPPGDDSVHGDKACVSFGTKGVDQACFGYTKLSN